MQPATKFVDLCGESEIHGGFEPYKLIYTNCCDKPRYAKDCIVQCYYDGLSIWCAQNKGCKDPLVIAERKAREFANRSAGQKRRWSKTIAPNLF